MATQCIQTATLGHTTIPLVAGRGVLRPQTTPFCDSDGQTMLPVLAELSVKSHRLVSELYAAQSPAIAQAFRAGLDRRLYERDRAPVAWQPVAAARAA
jgi:hypothetical protein